LNGRVIDLRPAWSKLAGKPGNQYKADEIVDEGNPEPIAVCRYRIRTGGYRGIQIVMEK
jgi:hypothetical protein